MRYELHLDTNGNYHLLDIEQNLISAYSHPDIAALFKHSDYTTANRNDHSAWYSKNPNVWFSTNKTTVVYAFNSIEKFKQGYPELFI